MHLLLFEFIVKTIYVLYSLPCMAKISDLLLANFRFKSPNIQISALFKAQRRQWVSSLSAELQNFADILKNSVISIVRFVWAEVIQKYSTDNHFLCYTSIRFLQKRYIQYGEV